MISRQLTFAFLSVSFLAQAGGVFWSDRGASQLKRMNFDGTGLQIITLSGAVTTPGNNIRGIAVDNVNNRIFWADRAAARLLRANYSGSSSIILYTITGGSSFPADVRIDQANQLFYWCDRDRNRIQRSTFNGTSVTDVITNATPVGIGPYFMDLDPIGGKIYWGDGEGESIYRSNLDGTGWELLLTGNNKTRGVKVDPYEGMLYWVNRDDKKIHRCSLTAFLGGPITLSHPAVQTLYTNLDTPHGLEIDLPARKLYWADTGTNLGAGTGEKAVNRGDFDGSMPQEILATGSEPWDVDLDRRCATYSEWRMRCFHRDLSPLQTDPAADPDQDGVVNALEYAFDLSPMHPDAIGLPEGFITFGPVIGAGYQALKFRRRTGTSDLTFYVQTSTNLVTWTGTPGNQPVSEIQVTSLGDGMQDVTVRTTAPVSGLSSHYLKLNVVLGP